MNFISTVLEIEAKQQVATLWPTMMGGHVKTAMLLSL